MTTAELLNRAADLIEPESVWIQGKMAAYTPTSGEADPRNPAAKCFCAIGAMCRVANARNWSELPDGIDTLILVAAGDRSFSSVADWNDYPGRTQSEVVQALRDAAKAAS